MDDPTLPPEPTDGPLSPDHVLPPGELTLDDSAPHTAMSEVSDTTLAEATQAAITEKLQRGMPLTMAEKQKQAVALRIGGASYRRIGEILGVSHTSAKYYCDKALKEHAADSVEELRMVQFARLEHMLMLTWPMVNHRDMGAIHTARALIKDENDLMGVTIESGGVTINTSGNTVIATGQKEEYMDALRQARKSQEATDAEATNEQAAQSREAEETEERLARNETREAG